MEFSGFPELLKSTLPLEAAEEMKNLREPDSAWMKQESFECSLKEFKIQQMQNRYTIYHEDVPFECLWLPSKKQKLYVSLSGGGPANGRRYPWFIRWKYKNFLDGHVLCIDDPMYHFHPEIVSAMWYYGTNETSYLHLLLDIVKKFMEQIGIEAKDVTFIGSSGGGYSSLYCANLLDYSSAIAVNPQIVLKDWHYPYVYNHFAKWGIDLASEDQFDRNNVLLKNKTSKFMLIMNVGSVNEAKLQFEPFFQRHGIVPTYGISQKDNIITWVHVTNYNNPHSAYPEKAGFKLASYLLELAKTSVMCEGYDLNELSNISLLANEVLYEKYDLKNKLESIQTERNAVYRFFIHTISECIKENLYRKIPIKTSENLRRFLAYDYEIRDIIRSKGNIGYYIGAQEEFRYNIYYHEGEFYFRMKFDGFSKYFKNAEEIKNYLNTIKGHRITRWHISGDTLIISYILEPEMMETQIDDFVNLTLMMINKYL